MLCALRRYHKDQRSQTPVLPTQLLLHPSAAHPNSRPSLTHTAAPAPVRSPSQQSAITHPHSGTRNSRFQRPARHRLLCGTSGMITDVSHFVLRSLGIDIKTFHVRFVVYEVALGQVFLRAPRFPLSVSFHRAPQSSSSTSRSSQKDKRAKTGKLSNANVFRTGEVLSY